MAPVMGAFLIIPKALQRTMTEATPDCTVRNFCALPRLVRQD